MPCEGGIGSGFDLGFMATPNPKGQRVWGYFGEGLGGAHRGVGMFPGSGTTMETVRRTRVRLSTTARPYTRGPRPRRAQLPTAPKPSPRCLWGGWDPILGVGMDPPPPPRAVTRHAGRYKQRKSRATTPTSNYARL